jgi:hypothetical protein
MGMADPELLAQWILHMMGPSSELIVESRYAGMGKSWRVKDRREASALPVQEPGADSGM